MRELLRRPIVLWFATVWLGLAIGIVRSQDAVFTEPSLKFTGPPQQTLLVAVRYYDHDQLVKTVTSRIEIGQATQPLEPGHDGLRAFVVVATQQLVTVSVVAGANEVSVGRSESPQIIELAAGDVPPRDDFIPPRAFLDATETEFARRFLDCVQAASTADIVSPLPIANIQWQTLDAYCEVLNDELGQLAQRERELDGWLSWDGNLGVRVISGIADFEQGRCRFTLMALQQELVDVLVESHDMPSDWFDGPSSLEIYIQQSEQLLRTLLSGDPASAHELFSARFREQISTEELTKLSHELQDQFGHEVASIRFIDSSLSALDFQTRTKRLSTRLLVALASGKSGLATVHFIFPCGANIIGRGELASVHMRETWVSAYPQQLPLAKQAILPLLALISAQQPEQAASALLPVAHFHRGLQENLSPQRLAELVSEIRQHKLELGTEVDWEQWTFQSLGANVSASGRVVTNKGPIDIQADFCEDQLLGLTFLGDTLAASTHDALQGVDATVEVADKFWRAVCANDFVSAHALLSENLQVTLPLEDFEAIVLPSGLGGSVPLTSIELDSIRVSRRLDRKSTIAFDSYAIAQLADGSYVPLQCELGKSVDKFAVQSFSSSFAATFPADDFAKGKEVLAALFSGDPQNVIALAHPSEHEQFAPEILRAFQANLQKRISTQQFSDQAASFHIYANGNRSERVKAMLASPSGDVAVEAVFEFGYLKAFYFGSPELEDFASELKSIESLEVLNNQFIEGWLKHDGVSSMTDDMVIELRDDRTAAQLKLKRDRLYAEQGVFLQSQLLRWTVTDIPGEVELFNRLEFAQGSVTVSITFRLDAIRGWISGLQVADWQP